MLRNLSILAAAIVVVALPFLLRKPGVADEWKPGDPELVIITPHNEAIRYEFGRAFSAWHQRHFGRPVRVDWRAIGGTTEISRYLTAQFVASARAWWIGQDRAWNPALGESLTDRKFDPHVPPTEARALERWELAKGLVASFRNTDDPTKFTAKIDLFFGGGEYDHNRAAQEGLTVPPWPAGPPPGLFAAADGAELIPEKIGGETWRSANYFGTCVGTFGICYNLDRLRDLGITNPPARWADLADPIYFRQLGVADPTKSGSIAKAFELILHQQCYDAVRAAGYDDAQIRAFEGAIRKAGLAPGVMPPDVPADYQAAIEAGWRNGLLLVRRIGANARYFTDSASKVPIDVSSGNAAAGLAIDFYARYQAQMSRAPDGTERMRFLTPPGGSGASCDPISLLRGAEHREMAVRFIEFVLGEDGQKLWTYRPGTPGGPEKFALRRLPIRRDFYPSERPEFQTAHERHLRFAADDLADPLINPYEITKHFTYYGRWTGAHFNFLRDFVRAMCMDSSVELQAAWRAGAELGPLPDRPEALTWTSALDIGRRYDRLDYMREWTVYFRDRYRDAAAGRTGGGA